MIHIDGSSGEGGGQILRSALTLALLTGRSFSLENIRARRPKPGLRPQHRQAVLAAAAVSDAEVEGSEVNSMTLTFRPGRVRPGDYRFDIGTAGATSLVLQTVYLPLALAASPSTVVITGGTHVPFSPCFHFLDLHWSRFLGHLGIELTLEMERAGFYPPGGRLIRANIQPSASIHSQQLIDRGALQRIEGISAVAGLPTSMAKRQMTRAMQRLAGVGDCRLRNTQLSAPSKGTLLLLLARFENAQACFFALGERGKPAERVADEAVDQLVAFLATDAALDPFVTDQLMLPLALAGGQSTLSTSQITQHQLSNADVIQQFLPVELRAAGEPAEPGSFHIRASGLEPTR